ncbi:hypothetical protein M6D81_06520 [Paenibacillus sp. J5C_2022]|uniref:hypothetical protein n=1 Tax=Paenibacillus sp. J5C2022 TaxID=2977129 RepID=UPI0021CEBA21|nr:hypothetical protein [Paenibacillus sp. J5C2022]MCU6708365.1 hypothetical protein [Paenibacillus sp. J5C2022]
MLAWLFLLMTAAGCQSSSSPAVSSEDQSDAYSGEGEVEQAESAELTGESESDVITQEEADIKFRIDMPEIEQFLGISEEGPVIPGLKQGAIPQGLAYMPENDWLLISYYREDGKPSLLAAVDKKSGEFVKAVELFEENGAPYTGHAGGVAVSRSHIWISSGGSVYWMNSERLIEAENGGQLTFQGAVLTDTRASFVSYADGILWVGEYAQGVDYPTGEHHYRLNREGQEHRAWAAGYKLDMETDHLPVREGNDSLLPAVPDYILSIPDRVQGVAIANGEAWLSQSYGRNNSSELTGYSVDIQQGEPHEMASIEGKDVPLWFLDGMNQLKQHIIPPMSEGIVNVEGTLYILVESAAQKFVTSSAYPIDRLIIWNSERDVVE